MVEVNFRSAFQDFNPSKFVVFLSLLFFSFFLALRQDNLIQWPYVVVFAPLWIWKMIAITGAIVGCVLHGRQPPSRIDASSELEFKGMVFCLTETLLLFMFEILVCLRLESQLEALKWTFVFIPLITLSLISIGVCIWALKRNKNLEFELFFAVNILQIVFVALRMDNYVLWSWVTIFVPLWIVICVSLIGVLYAIVLAILLIRSIDLLPEHRRQHLFSAVGYTLLVVPVLVFLIMLTKKLDQDSKIPHVMVCLPLYISLVCLIFMACGTRGGNHWWFGIRKDFCQWILDSCPWLQEYGNVSYRFANSTDQLNQSGPRESRRFFGCSKTDIVRDSSKPVVPFVSIDAPD